MNRTIITLIICAISAIYVMAQSTESSQQQPVQIFAESKNRPLILLNGKTFPYDSMKFIDPKTIESIDVIKNPKADSLYGERGKNGVIVIRQKGIRQEKP